MKLGDVLSKPRHSLVTQSFDASFHPGFTARNNALLNADGFGISWYSADGRCFTFKSVSPAWSDPNLRELADFIASTTIFGHVRAASPGSVVSHENCHPFKHGRLAFMHNGHVEGFAQLRRALLGRLSDSAFASIRGLTDSEHCMALLLSNLADPGRATPFEPAELAAAMVATIAAVLELLSAAGVQEGFTSLNFALTDGATVVATRFCDKWPAVPAPSLYFAFPTCADLELELSSESSSTTAAACAAAPAAAHSQQGPGDGSHNHASSSGGAAAAPALSGGAADAHARQAARWAQDEAFLTAAAATPDCRALLIASEPATEGQDSRLVWLAMPSNTMLVYSAASGKPPQLSRLDQLLPPAAL